MDNIFLIQYLGGEINVLNQLNERDKALCADSTVSEVVEMFLRGAIEARSYTITRFVDRIIEAEKELAAQAAKMQRDETAIECSDFQEGVMQA